MAREKQKDKQSANETCSDFGWKKIIERRTRGRQEKSGEWQRESRSDEEGLSLIDE